MTKEQAFDIGLPKWPQCIIKGDKITEEQALEIIRRTDSFFHGFAGNNHEFNNKAYKIIKRPNIDDRDEYLFEDYWDDVKEWNNKWNLLDTHYLANHWISSSYIYGPHGWCHPNGIIEYHYNIGKYPEVEEVFNELCMYAKEFPFLNMTVTLMSDEECIDESEPLVSMKVVNGCVDFIDTLSKDELNYKEYVIDFNNVFSLDRSSENYFSLDQLQKWHDEVFNGSKVNE